MYRKLLLAMAAVAGFIVGYGVLAHAYPSPPPFGRAPYYGYFKNQHDPDQAGAFVLDNTSPHPPQGFFAIPDSVDTAATLESFIQARYNDGVTWDETGASFIIETMIGNTSSTRPYPATSAEFNTWKADVDAYYAAAKISWFKTNYCFTLNTYYEHGRSGPGPDDDAFFDQAQQCTDSNFSAIVFTNPDGSTYAIRRQCANPIGDMSPLQALTKFAVNGSTTVNDTTPNAGDTITFKYYVKNGGPNSTSPSTIAWTARNSLSLATISSGNAGVLTVGQKTTPVYTENYTILAATPPGTKICRQTLWQPKSSTVSGTGTGIPVCATVQAVYSLKPTVNVTILDPSGTAVTGGVAEPGDSISFTYAVKNNSVSASAVVNCSVFGLNKVGYYAAPAPPGTDQNPPALAVGTGCPRSFPGSVNTTLTTEAIPAASIVANRTICRTLYVNPADSATGNPDSAESCVPIAAKPYMRVYGGDVSAGNGFADPSGVCTQDNAAAIIGWNRENSAIPNTKFAGAGVQFAALALSDIFDSSTALGNSGGGLPPSGLAFANVGKPVGGDFGGSFGSLPCITDYYDNEPSGPTSVGPIINLSSLPTGVYDAAGGAVKISGNINPITQIALYVNGDVHITADIKYPGSWTLGNIPLFELIVGGGNIYVNRGVHQIDGLYVAQPIGGVGGTIFTCDNNPDGTLYANCSTNKLTINGAFVASEVDFLRTQGSLNQATSNELATTGHAAEVFNYSPALWMATPPGQPTNVNYDSITSLPPIL